MNPIRLTEGDLRQHIIKIGLDFFPPIEMANERTRLNMFAEEIIQRFPSLFERLVSSSDEFKVSRRLHMGATPQPRWVDSLTVTARGPVFTFPVLIAKPSGSPVLQRDYKEDELIECTKLLLSHLPVQQGNRQIIRAGMVRELVFMGGRSSFADALTSRASFAGAKLHGGRCDLGFHDDRCGIHLQIIPLTLMQSTPLPVGGTVQQGLGYGVQVILDVHNAQVRPLADDEVKGILDRATSLWPEALLSYLAGDGSP